MKLTIDDKDVQKFAKLVFLGRFMINGCRRFNKVLHEYDDLARSLVLACAEQEKGEPLSEEEAESYWNGMKELAEEDIRNYDEGALPDALVLMLARRMFPDSENMQRVARMVFYDEIDTRGLEAVSIDVPDFARKFEKML